MSDLSQLLGDLYADDTASTPPPAAVPVASHDAEAPTQVWSMDDDGKGTPAPSWSSEAALDEAFATWVPGPTADAPSAERSMVAAVMDDRPAAPAPAPVATAPMAAPVPAAAPAYHPLEELRSDPTPVPAPPMAPPVLARWTPSDDDILPARRSRKRR